MEWKWTPTWKLTAQTQMTQNAPPTPPTSSDSMPEFRPELTDTLSLKTCISKQVPLGHHRNQTPRRKSGVLPAGRSFGYDTCANQPSQSLSAAPSFIPPATQKNKITCSQKGLKLSNSWKYDDYRIHQSPRHFGPKYRQSDLAPL